MFSVIMPTKNVKKKRVNVYIDNSNIFHSLLDLSKVDRNWIRMYNPLHLAESLVGGRKLQKVFFYCAPPPGYLLSEREGKMKYWKTLSYYNKVESLKNVELKYATLKGGKGNLQEKNLDTQLSIDLYKDAQLNNYDIAIIVSNDGDYVAAVEGVKTMKKRIEVAYFRNMLSMSLKQSSDLARRIRPSYIIRLDAPAVDENGNSIE